MNPYGLLDLRYMRRIYVLRILLKTLNLLLEHNMKTELLLIRGIPGSGKSTLAKTMLKTHKHIESDQFFTNKRGQFIYIHEKARLVHLICQKATLACLRKGNDTVVSNCFSEMWEIDPYIEIAIKTDSKLKIILCNGKYKSVHDISVQKMKEYKKRFKKITNKDVKLRKFKLKGKM